MANKTGGRQKGTPNRVTGELRELLLDGLRGNIERIPEYFDKIEDTTERLEMLIKILPYVIPRMNKISVEDIPTVSFTQLLGVPAEEEQSPKKSINQAEYTDYEEIDEKIH